MQGNVAMSERMGRTGAQLLVDGLALQAVDRIFCVPGESYIAVLDALHDKRNEIELVVCRQEGGAANMAEAHGKLTGRPGICFVTRGPGATNASIGVHTAFQDSTPMILFIGQVGRDFIDREGFQEVDFRAMFAPLAKWVAQIDDPARIPEYLHRAFQTAMAGRPGPVVLALPEDMLSQIVEGEIDLGRRAEPIPAAPRPDQVADVMAMLAQARRPLVIAGGGGWTTQAGRDLVTFAERNRLPVAVSLRCQDYLPNREECFVGHFGIGAEPSLAKRLAESDLLLVLGPRLARHQLAQRLCRRQATFQHRHHGLGDRHLNTEPARPRLHHRRGVHTLGHVAQVQGTGIRDAHHGGGMETRPYGEAGRQMLVRSLAADGRCAVVRTNPCRETPMLLEVTLEFLRIHPFRSRFAGTLGAVAEHLGPLAVEIDQLLGHDLALAGVGMQ